ncbi:hypothetical protein [Haloarcula rubripromontorii]|nr:hypothetical protein [Haloarcula rubripromontorii]
MALTYAGKIPVDELCDAFEDPDHKLNDWLDEHGIDASEEAEEAAKEMSKNLEDAADSADYAVEVGQDVVDEIEDTIEGGLDDIGDIINMGQNFVI